MPNDLLPTDNKRVDFPNGQMDFVGLSTNEKPDERDFGSDIGFAWGSTYYEVDTGKLFILWDGTWYEQP